MTSFYFTGGSHDLGATGIWDTLNAKGALVATTAVPGVSDLLRINTAGTLTGSTTASEMLINTTVSIDATTNLSVLTVIGNSAAATVIVSGGTWDSSGGVNSGLVVGNSAGGNVTVESGGVLTDSGSLTIGRVQPGAVSVLSGSTLDTTGTFDSVGENSGGAGAVTVDGTLSTWVSSTELLVGDNGAGTLTVKDSGSVDAQGLLVLGNAAGSSGTLNVTSGGMLDSGGDLVIGDSGSGTLTIGDGGSAVAASLVALGNVGGSVGTLYVTAGGSFTAQNDLIVGVAGAGTLTVDGGGSVAVAGTLNIDGGGGTGAVQVSGASNVSAAYLTTGLVANLTFGAGSTLAVTGTVSDDTVPILDAVALAGTLALHGASLQSGGRVIIGADSAEAVAVVDSGATATAWSTEIGDAPGFGGSLTITGPNTTWTDAGGPATGSTATGGTMLVGGGTADSAGTTATLDVLAGATLSEAAGAIVASVAGDVASVTIDGANSLWKVSGLVDLGDGGSATLTVSDAASLDAVGGLEVGTSSAGQMTVDSGGTVTSGKDLQVGAQGVGSLVVQDARLIAQADLGVGVQALGDMAIGAASTVSVAGNLDIADGATAGSLDIGGGSALTALYLSADTLSQITEETGASIEVAGTVTSGANARLDAVALDGTMTVDGATLDAGGQISVDASTADAALTVKDGAEASLWATVLGGVPGYTGSLFLSGKGTTYSDIGGPVPGNTLSTGGYMVLGAGAIGLPLKGSNGILSITDGATLSEADFAIVGGQTGDSGTVTVDGSLSSWTIAGALQVGGSGTGTMTISNGALVEAEAEIQIATGASGGVSVQSGGTLIADGIVDTIGGTVGANGTLSISGVGSNFQSNGGLSVGSGGLGQVIASDSGTLSVGGTLSLGDTGVGKVTLESGGALTAGDGVVIGLNGGTGSLEIDAGGTLTSEGTLDSLASGAGSTAEIGISGSGAYWSSGGALSIGAGGDAVASVGAGGSLSVIGALSIGAGGTGDLTVGSDGSVAVGGALAVGNGGGGTLDVQAGGSMTVTAGALVGGNGGSGVVTVEGSFASSATADAIGDGTGSSGSVTIDGAGAAWSSAGALSLGQGGGGALTLEAGGVASAAGFGVGSAGGSGTLAILAGSTLTTTGTAELVLGGSSASASATVDGSGALWSAAGGIEVGGSGSATLAIGDGGQLTLAAPAAAAGQDGLLLGDAAGGSGLLTLSASTLDAGANAMIVGLGGAGTAEVSAGGSLNAGAGLLLGTNAGASGTLTIDGSGGGATATVGSTLQLGSSAGGVADVALTDGGQLLSAVSVAMFAGSTLAIDGTSGMDIGGATPQVGDVQIEAAASLAGAGEVNAAASVAGSILATGGTLGIAGNVSLAGGQLQVAGDGALAIGDSATLGLGTAAVLSGATLSGSGSVLAPLAVAGTVSAAGGMLALDGNVSLSPLGALALGAPGLPAGALTIGNATAAAGWIAVGDANGISGAGSLDGPVLDSGQLAASGGALAIDGDVTLTAGAVVTADGSGVVDIGGSGAAADGRVQIESGFTLSGAGEVQGPVANAGAITAVGGTLDFTGDITGAGALQIGTGATLRLDANAGPTSAGFLDAAGGTLEIIAIAGASFNVATLGTADTILFEQGVVATGAVVPLQTFQGVAGQSLGFTVSGTPGDLTVSEQLPCFAAGTRIATARGEVAVEALTPGARVMLARDPGATAEIVWLGHRHIDCRRHPRPQEVWPVRVAADAFAKGRPARDLYLSPDHAVFTGGALIPVRYLVNGDSIAQIPVERVTYWHVELAAHDVVLAENLPCESYLDTGNRAAFANGGGVVQAHPNFARAVWAKQACAPLVLDGSRLTRAKARLLSRLRRAITPDPAMRLFADGRPLAADWVGPACRAALPPGAQRLTLRSRTARPCDLTPASRDTRLLGVALLHLTLNDTATPLDSPRFGAGWLAAEPQWRWTEGDAWLDVRGVTTLELQFGNWHRYLEEAIPAPQARARA